MLKVTRSVSCATLTQAQMFLSAAATSMLTHGVVSCTRRGSAAVGQLLCRKSDKDILITALGAAVLGSGMALAGACPGTILAQIGSGQVRPNESSRSYANLAKLAYRIYIRSLWCGPIRFCR